jgi:hypothetical protein
MDEFPKAVTNADGDQVVVNDAAQEAEAAIDGYYFGGPDSAPAKRGRPRKAD